MKLGKLVVAAACMVVAALPILAHHELRAEFDEHKPVTLRGIVTRFDWNNPHALLYVDVRDNGGETVNWAVEWASPLDLRTAGWTRDALKVGDSVTIEGWLARDGSKLASGRTVLLASGKKLSEAPDTEAAPSRAQAKPTPRWPDGHPRLGVVPGETGYWAHPSAASLVESTAGNIKMDSNGLLANPDDAGKVVQVIGSPELTALYARAIAACGGYAERHDGEAAARGLALIAEHAQWS